MLPLCKKELGVGTLVTEFQGVSFIYHSGPLYYYYLVGLAHDVTVFMAYLMESRVQPHAHMLPSVGCVMQ
jgi:hypothetical protein